MIQRVSSSNRCKSCNRGSILTDSNTWEMFCSKYGFVATDRVEQEGVQNEDLFPKKEESRTRKGTTTSLAMHDMGLATIINPQNKDALLEIHLLQQ